MAGLWREIMWHKVKNGEFVEFSRETHGCMHIHAARAIGVTVL